MQLGIRAKLFGSFGIVLVLLVALAGFGLLKLTDATQTLRGRNAKVEASFDDALTSYRTASATLTNVLYTDAGKAKLATLTRAFDTWLPVRTQVVTRHERPD